MWVILLAGVYVACGAVLLAVLLQDRAKTVGVGRRREDGDSVRRTNVMPDMVFRTHA
jgi:hypothetical protein